MIERPILMSGPLVLATLEGRKTVTRRTSDAWAKARPGDVLWVKETWAVSAQWDGIKPRDIPETTPIHYFADEPLWSGRLRPSIFMMRWMSRLRLLVENIRRERLHDITDADAIAEGIVPLPLQEGEAGCWWTSDVSAGRELHGRTPVDAFRQTWVLLNGLASWQANPFVRRIAFRRIYP